MSIGTTLKNGWNSIKAMKPSVITAKAIGVAGVATALYDSHHWAKLRAYDKKNSGYANAGLNYFNNTQYLNNRSHMTTKLKQKLFNWELSQNFRGAWNNVTGYIGGFLGTIARHTIPLTASIATLALKGKKSVISAGVVAAWSAYSFLRNTCSHFNHKP